MRSINIEMVFWATVNQDGATRLNSWVVAQGFTQTFGIDHDKTCAPVTWLASLWTICTIAACNDWLIHQMDVYNAYMNADLEEGIYIRHKTTSGIHQKRQSICPQAEKSYVWTKIIRSSMVQVSVFCNEQAQFYKIKIQCSSILQTWRKRFCNYSCGHEWSDNQWLMTIFFAKSKQI